MVLYGRRSLSPGLSSAEGLTAGRMGMLRPFGFACRERQSNGSGQAGSAQGVGRCRI